MLSQSELQDIRAYQRTFEGAYWRTSLSALSMGLLILKVFTIEFFHIALVFFSFGLSMLVFACMRHLQFKQILNPTIPVKTSGNMVVLTFASSLIMFLALFVLILQLDP